MWVSIEHGFDFVVEGLVVQIVDLDGLEIFLGIEVALSDEEGLPEDEFLRDLDVTLILASSQYMMSSQVSPSFLLTLRKLATCSVVSFSPLLLVGLQFIILQSWLRASGLFLSTLIDLYISQAVPRNPSNSSQPNCCLAFYNQNLYQSTTTIRISTPIAASSSKLLSFQFALKCPFNLQLRPFRIQMLLFLVAIFLLEVTECIETVILTTDEQLVLYNGYINSDFIIKNHNFDCSSYLYAYSQPYQEYYQNKPIQLNISNLVNDKTLSVNTVYNHFYPTLTVDVCQIPSCMIQISHNCPLQLDNENYFDIVQLTITDIGTFSYELNCNQEFYPTNFEWGQFIISVCATVVLIFATVFARLESFGGSGIQYSFRWIVLVSPMIFGVGIMTIYAPNAAAIFLNVVSWIVSPISVGIVTLQILFLFVRHTVLRTQCRLGKLRVRIVDIISLIIGIGFTFAWWFSSKNWVLSDIIGICIIVSIIKVFKFISLKIAVVSYIIVVSIFILGVILPEVLLGKASSAFFIAINNPFQFQIPSITPTYNLNCSWVAITSISFPGLLVAYLHRFDKSRATNIYLLSTIVAYFLGAILWNVVNAFSRYPIPFDGVCEPFMIVSLVLMAFNRKELRTIWDGTFHDEQFVNKNEIQMLGKSLSVESPNVDQLQGFIPKNLFLGEQELSCEVNENSIKDNLIPEDKL